MHSQNIEASHRYMPARLSVMEALKRMVARLTASPSPCDSAQLAIQFGGGRLANNHVVPKCVGFFDYPSYSGNPSDHDKIHIWWLDTCVIYHVPWLSPCSSMLHQGPANRWGTIRWNYQRMLTAWMSKRLCKYKQTHCLWPLKPLRQWASAHAAI